MKNCVVDMLLCVIIFKASHKECERLSIQVYQEVSLSAVA